LPITYISSKSTNLRLLFQVYN